MAAHPDVLQMKDWGRPGQMVVGEWRLVGRTVLANTAGGVPMYCDYRPHNLNGQPLPASLNGRGYWKIHLPAPIDERVDLHRQLLRDFLGDELRGFDVHHRHGKHSNCVDDLEKGR